MKHILSTRIYEVCKEHHNFDCEDCRHKDTELRKAPKDTEAKVTYFDDVKKIVVVQKCEVIENGIKQRK